MPEESCSINVNARLNKALLAAKMVQFGETQASLAMKLGIAKETVNRWLKADTDCLPRAERLCALAAYFSTASPVVHVARPGDEKHSLVLYSANPMMPALPAPTKKFSMLNL